MDLTISYSWNHFVPARREAIRILKQFGDLDPQIEGTGVPGIAIAHTALNNREVIQKCRELFRAEPAFQFTMKWVPVDFWCETRLEAMKEVIEKEIRDQIRENEAWAMKVEKHRWQQYHTIDIINLKHPDKIVRIDVLGKRTAISLLKPDAIFSIATAV